MSLGQTDTENPLRVVQNDTNVARTTMKHKIDSVGMIIAEMEVAALDSFTMLIGSYTESGQPNGFCVEYNFNIEQPELVTTQVTSRKVAGGFQYFLQITNKTNKALCAEIRVL